jgi:hydrogenase maturation protein HypF
LGSVGFERVGHLEAQPLLGGDLASRYPVRVAAGVLSTIPEVNLDAWLSQISQHLPHGKTEANLILNQLKNGAETVQTTSCGRILDAAAALLGICYARSYEGEPAMKLESTALLGRDVLALKPVFKDEVLETTPLVRAVFEGLGRFSVADLAYSTHAYLAQGLGMLAVQKAQEKSVKTVGFSGGAACNQLLAEIMRVTVESAGSRFVVHEAVPAGDGGVAFGQAVVAGFCSF